MRRLTSPRLGLQLICILALLSATIGCSTHAQRVRTAREHFFAGDLAAAERAFTHHLEAKPKDADATSLDLAMVQLFSGQPAQAEQTLRRVRDNLEHFEQQDLLETGTSLLSDDQHLAYAGTNYERVLTRVFLSVANLLHDGQEAEAYSLQVNAKQEELLQKAVAGQVPEAEATYAPLAIGPYLRGVLRESTYGNYDDAARAYHQVVSWRPQFQSGEADLARARNGVHCPPGHGVVYVFAMVNRGPVREQVAEIPTSAAMLVADRILSQLGEYDVPPTLASIKIPKVVIPPREIDHLSLRADGKPVGRTETICDIAELAVRQEALEMPEIMGRAVARRVIKKAAIYATKDYAEVASPMADLGLSALGVFWEATEAADTRCWGLLPREIQVARVELPTGQHTLEFGAVRLNGSTIPGTGTEVEVEDGRNTYVAVCFPSSVSVGPPVQRYGVSSPIQTVMSP